MMTIDISEATFPGNNLFQLNKKQPEVGITMTLADVRMATLGTALSNYALFKMDSELSVECTYDLVVNVLQLIPLSTSGLVFSSFVDNEVWIKNSLIVMQSENFQDNFPDLDVSAQGDKEYWTNLYEYFINKDQMAPSYHIERTLHWTHFLPESVYQATLRVPPLSYVFGAQHAGPKWLGEMSGFFLDFADKVCCTDM